MKPNDSKARKAIFFHILATILFQMTPEEASQKQSLYLSIYYMI